MRYSLGSSASFLSVIDAAKVRRRWRRSATYCYLWILIDTYGHLWILMGTYWQLIISTKTQKTLSMISIFNKICAC